ncbi:hypothetical protein M8998_06410 [Sphingobacterium sp. lm-10]|uniref:hypothetical protein n=1 Tax=Sphingobacterium sp. lm-10 TaxID=2944904 RepID=UPI0020201A83|nr:hypothetical protein [Sphingobacterium sp. lm-10]MCL7987566.1 hypothetical protein [Sphingobacterium sp. lm-10]
MKKDLPENSVVGIDVAVVLESDSPHGKVWNVYLINEKQADVQNVLVSSKGYGIKDNRDVKTTTLRHFLGDVSAKTAVKIEAIDTEVFGLTNEYWVSYYENGVMYDKKYIFLPESIVDENLIKAPFIGKPAVMIGGQS